MESISPVYDGGEMSSKSNALEDFAENSRIKKTNKPRYPFLPSFLPPFLSSCCASSFHLPNFMLSLYLIKNQMSSEISHKFNQNV
jgi:hypothetical protein